ncbi:MAG TPA: NADP-dependent oxidoreductase [Propionicimonas sp.]|jgi:NADPH:quinone reductase-like Zn-dependent oxidoreductase
MRAAVFPELGTAPEVRDDLSVPEPAEGEVRVRVHAASVNGFDLAVANGYLTGMMEHRFPVVLGKDFAGTVDAIGPGVEGYAHGDRVFGVVTKAFLGDGSFGELVTVPVAIGVAPLPDAVSFADGAAVGLAGTAASDAVAAAHLSAGQTVLIAGATGGVGGYAVQLAAAAGATVIATAHTEQETVLVTGLGAAQVVDHTGDVASQVRSGHPDGVDVVIHLAGDPAALLATVRDGGRFVSTLIGTPDQVPSTTVTVVPVYATPTGEVLGALAAAVADGRLRVSIDSVFPLAEMPDALAHFTSGTRGKVVITIV